MTLLGRIDGVYLLFPAWTWLLSRVCNFGTYSCNIHGYVHMGDCKFKTSLKVFGAGDLSWLALSQPMVM